METYGLGLILSFTDNATSGIRNALGNLQNLQETASNAVSSLDGLAQLGAFSGIANNIGSEMMSAGKGIVNFFNNSIQSVSNVGREMGYARNQIAQLYGSVEEGNRVVQQAQEYAKTSMFEFSDLTSGIIMLKANGIEAFQDLSAQTNGLDRNILDLAADLAAFNPAMKNAYGTGINAALGAFNEYIAEGNERSLKAGASLDITGLLGESKGATPEERLDQITRLMMKMNMAGYSVNMSGSAEVAIGNMQDTLEIFQDMIATQGGVYQAYTDLINIFAEFVASIPDETLESLATIIGGAFTSLIEPLKQVAHWITEIAGKIIEFVQQNPQVADFAIKFAAIGGVLLFVGGIVMKVMSYFGQMAIFMRSAGSFLPAMAGGFAQVAATMLPLIGIIGALAIAWKNDLGGLRTSVLNIVSSIRNAFDTANSIMSQSVSDFEKSWDALMSGPQNFETRLSAFLVKIRLLWSGIRDVWNDGKIDDTDLAKKLNIAGLTELIDKVYAVKERVTAFIHGFAEGFVGVWKSITSFIAQVSQLAEGTIFETMFKKLEDFLDFLTNMDVEEWNSIGKTLGSIGSIVLPLLTAFGLLRRLGNPFAGIFNTFRRFLGGAGGNNDTGAGGGLFGGLFRALFGAGGGMNVGATLQTIASISLIVTAIVGLSSLFGWLANNVDGFVENMQAGSKIALSIGEFLGNFVGGVLGGILGGAAEVFTNHLPAVAEGLNAFITGLVPFFDTINSINLNKSNLSNVMSAISQFMLMAGGAGFMDVANRIFNGGRDSFSDFGSTISSFVDDVVPAFDKLATVNSAGIDNAAQVFNSLGSVSQFKTGGLFSFFTGNIDLKETGKQIGEFASSSKEAFDNFAAFNEAGLQKAPKAFEAISAMGGYEYKDGGLAQLITGGNQVGEIGERLAVFASSAKDAFNDFASFSESGIEKAPGIFEAISAMGGYEYKDGGLAQLITGGNQIGEIGGRLKEFASSSKEAFTSFSQFPDAGIEKAPKIFDAISALGNYEFKAGGLSQLITGDSGFGVQELGKGLANFAKSAKEFFTTAGQLDESSISKGGMIFEAISGISDDAYKTMGLAQLFEGTTDLTHMGNELSNFAKGMKPFFSTVATINESDIAKVKPLFAAMKDVADMFTTDVFSSWVNTSTLGDLGNELSQFVSAQPFFDMLKTIDPSSVANITPLFRSLSEISEMFSSNRFSSWWETSSLASLGTELSNFATEVSGFINMMKGLDLASVTKIRSMFLALQEIGPLTENSKLGNGTLTRFGTELSAFAENTVGFFQKVSALDMGVFAKVRQMFQSLQEVSGLVESANLSNGSLKKFGEELNSFVDSFIQFSSKINSMGNGTEGLSSFVSSIQELVQNLTDAGSKISTAVTQIITSLVSLGTSLSSVNVAIMILNTSISTLNGYVSQFVSTFSNMAVSVSSFTNEVNTMGTTVSSIAGIVTSDFSNMESAVSTACSNMTTNVQNMATSVNNSLQSVSTKVNSVKGTFTRAMSSMGSSASSMAGRVSSAMYSVRGSIRDAESAFRNAKFEFNQSHISVPKFSMSGSFNPETGSVPSISVKWAAKGGLLDSATLIGAGEAGREAIVPLDRNTEWMDEFSEKVVSAIDDSRLGMVPPVSNVDNRRMVTTSNSVNYNTTGGTTENKEVHNDNRVYFTDGAIVVNALNASEQEAERLAVLVMDKIRRKNEIERIMNYK